MSFFSYPLCYILTTPMFIRAIYQAHPDEIIQPPAVSTNNTNNIIEYQLSRNFVEYIMS